MEYINGKYLRNKLKNVASVLRAIGLSGKLYGSLSNIILLKNSGRYKYPDILLKRHQNFTRNHICMEQRRQTELWKLVTYLRHRLKHRNRYAGAGKSHIHDRRSIHDRPIEADGKRFGDLEMDTIVEPNNQQAIVTLVDRSTNMLFMKKFKYGKDAKKLAQC